MSLLQEHPKVVVSATVVVIVLAIISIVRHDRTPPVFREVVNTFYDDLTLQVREVTAHLEEGTDLVVLIFAGTASPGSEGHLKRLYRSLKDKGLSVRHVEKLEWDPDKGWDEMRIGFPYKEYVRVAREYPDTGAILSLCAAPYKLNKAGRVDPAELPPLLVTRVGDWSPFLQSMLDSGRVAAAVVPSEDGGVGADAYEMLTAPAVQ